MRSQFSELELTYERELDSIETAFVKERAIMLDNNRAEIDALFQKRTAKEM